MSDSATKNPAEGPGESAPPAKKARTEPPQDAPPRKQKQEDPPKNQPPSDSGLLATLANRLSTPYSTLDTIYVQVLTEHMNRFFQSIRNALIEEVYLDTTDLPDNLVTQDQWNLVCRYVVKSRVDAVYGSTTGRRPDGRTPLPRNLKVPKLLADVANSIGNIVINSGAVLVVPMPEDNPAQLANRLNTLVTDELLSSFSRLVLLAEQRGFIRTSYLSSIPDGSAWWLLSARTTADHAQVCQGLNGTAKIYGNFKEWTPADAMYAAVVQRRFDGQFVNYLGLVWTTDEIREIASIRRQLALQA